MLRGAAAPAVPPAQPSCLAAGPRRAGAAGGGAAAGRRRPEPMAYSQGGGKKKVCYYYDGGWPGNLRRGCGEGAAGWWTRASGCPGWLSAGTGTRPTTRLRDRGPGTPARAPPLGSSARARGGLGCTASGRSPRNPSRYPGPDCTKPAAWSSAPRPRPLPRSPGPPSGGRRSVCAALPASPGTPPLGWGCGGVTAGRGPSSQSGAVSLVSCVDSIPRLCSPGSLSATFLGVQMERLRLARWTIKGC